MISPPILHSQSLRSCDMNRCRGLFHNQDRHIHNGHYIRLHIPHRLSSILSLHRPTFVTNVFFNTNIKFSASAFFANHSSTSLTYLANISDSSFLIFSGNALSINLSLHSFFSSGRGFSKYNAIKAITSTILFSCSSCLKFNVSPYLQREHPT